MIYRMTSTTEGVFLPGRQSAGIHEHSTTIRADRQPGTESPEVLNSGRGRASMQKALSTAYMTRKPENFIRLKESQPQLASRQTMAHNCRQKSRAPRTDGSKIGREHSYQEGCCFLSSSIQSCNFFFASQLKSSRHQAKHEFADDMAEY
jgi:hypothetical protein